MYICTRQNCRAVRKNTPTFIFIDFYTARRNGLLFDDVSISCLKSEVFFSSDFWCRSSVSKSLSHTWLRWYLVARLVSTHAVTRVFLIHVASLMSLPVLSDARSRGMWILELLLQLFYGSLDFGNNETINIQEYS